MGCPSITQALSLALTFRRRVLHSSHAAHYGSNPQRKKKGIILKIVSAAFIAAALAVGNAAAMTGGSVSPEFRGEWVPGNATCTSPTKLVIEANAVTFVNGSQRAAYNKLEQCFS